MGTYRAIILGGIWWPMGALGSAERVYQADGDDQATEKAYGSEAGDFSSVRDALVLARVECGGHGLLPHAAERMVKDWDSEENELAYLNTISEEEE